MSSIGSFRVRLKSRLAAGKPRTPPDSAGSGTATTLLLDSPAESEKCSTPYRLPRISPRGTPNSGDDSPVPTESDERVWGRFGYEDNVRMPELGPSVHKAHINAGSPSVSSAYTSSYSAAGDRSIAAAQRHRHNAMFVPKFRNAAITPSYNPNVIKDVDDVSVHVYKSLLEKAAVTEQHLSNPAPTPTANSRSVSPAKSTKSTKSIHWTLGSNRHVLFDPRGRSRKQGPYSREFTVRCMAPASWMRMKWGRQKTMVH